MPKLLNHALTHNQVKSLKAEGVYSDGHGLTLRIDANGNKRWYQRLTIGGTKRNTGIGAFPVVSLAEARNIALGNLLAVKQGRDVLAEKRTARAECKRISEIPTFRLAADTVLELRRPTWSNDRHAAQWISSLHNYAAPLSARKVSEITTADVLEILTPVAAEMPTNAQRIRQRLEIVFDWAIVQGYRVDNPASKAILRALPMHKESGKHHESLPYADVPAAFRKIAESTASPSSKGALQMMILNANRISEVTGADWSEIDWDSKIWTIPAARMKARKAHTIPLSTGALEVLRQAYERTDGQGLIFPGLKGKAVSSRTIELLLKRLEIQAVPHGSEAHSRIGRLRLAKTGRLRRLP